MVGKSISLMDVKKNLCEKHGVPKFNLGGRSLPFYRDERVYRLAGGGDKI